MTPVEEVLSRARQWTTVEADCREVLAAMPRGSVDHVITDPPYEAEAHTLQRRVKRSEPRSVSEWGGDDTRVAAVEALSFAPITDEQRRTAGREYARLATRWAIVFCQVEAAVKWQDALVDGGMTRRRIGIWVKPDGQPQLSGDRPGMGYESIVFAHAPGKSRWHGGGRSSVFVHNKWTPADGPNVHPTQKPPALLAELVELFTDPGELVLDPWCGSGSLGIICVRLGRRYIGVDNGKDANGKPWAEWAREGIEAELAGSTRAAHRAGQLGLFATK